MKGIRLWRVEEIRFGVFVWFGVGLVLGSV